MSVVRGDIKPRVMEALSSAPRTGFTTDEVMERAKDDRGTVYGCLHKLLVDGVVQRAGSGKTGGGERKPVRWRLKTVSVPS